MDFVTPIITPIVQSLLVPIRRHLGFLFSSSNNVKSMHIEFAKLDGAAHDMHTTLESRKIHRLVAPHRVEGWFEDVNGIKARKESISTDGIGCFNLKRRYKAGKDSSYIVKQIDRLITEKNEMKWPDEIIPLCAVSPEAHEEDRNQNRFESRYSLLNKALKEMENIMNQKMALCGMGGVGKTTMMEEMEKAANNRHMFDHIVKVVVGQNPNLLVIQQTIEEQTRTHVALTEKIEDNKSKELKNRFDKMSKAGKKKILVILDDVWQEFELKHIGLTSPLPTGFKLLLTSREESVCLKMGVKPSFIFKVEVLTDTEAKKLFWETTERDSHNYIEPVQKIGEDIVKRCGGLPIAIKTIASTLIGIKEKHKWEDALFCIQNQDFSPFRIHDKDNLVLINIFEFSYENLQSDELKAIFLLSGLFPEDYNIIIEDLVMYGWGLQFFKNMPNIAQARIRVKSHVDDLIRSNLLSKSEHEGCVKMHDLVRDFVLISFSKVKQASIVNHDNKVLEHLRGEDPYERILLNCKGMLEFPKDFNHPNLTLLKLMYGDKPLIFPEDFYLRMKKLEVLAYENMRQLKLPQPLSNLRALCLRSCSLVDVDISFLGDLINLEVLSLANCYIHMLPNEIGRLKKLRLLDMSGRDVISDHDLRGCGELYIDDGVFRNLEKLEELYMRRIAIRFMDPNGKDLKKLKLFALEFQFFKNEVRPVDVSFEKLKRFRISLGCALDIDTDDKSFKNTLKLVTSVDELLECKFNDLFRETEILHLKVDNMHYLEDILVPLPNNSFCLLKELCISDCPCLTYLFTVCMVKVLTELEILEVTSCPVLKSLVHGGNSEVEVITFHKLNILKMVNLPTLLSLCDFGHVIIELPQLTQLKLDTLSNFTSIFPGNNNNISAKQAFLKKEVVIPKLEILSLCHMRNLKEIWPCETTCIEEEEVNDTFMLKELDIFDCNSLVVLFTTFVVKRLKKLESLKVRSCFVLKSLVSGENGEVGLRKFESLKFMSLDELRALVSLCDHVNAMELPQLKELNLYNLPKIVSIFPEIVTPKLEIMIIFTMMSLKEIWSCEITSSEEEVYNTIMLKQLCIGECLSLIVLFPIPVAKRLKKLEILEVSWCLVLKSVVSDESREVGSRKFESLKSLSLYELPELVSLCDHVNAMELPQLVNLDLFNLPNIVTIFPKVISPKLEMVGIYAMTSLKEIWSSEATISEDLFMLQEIKVHDCNSLVNIFPINPMQLLTNLKELTVERCSCLEVLFNIDLGKIQQLCINNSLRNISVEGCENFREVCRIKDVENNFSSLRTSGFQSIEYLEIINCERFTKIMTLTTANFDLSATDIRIYDERKNELLKNRQEQEVDTMSSEDILKVGDKMSMLAFPSYHITPNFRHLRRICFNGLNGVEVAFEIESTPSNRDQMVTTQQQPLLLLPYLEEIELNEMDMLSHVWKCNNWKEFFVFQKRQPQSSFHNLKTIELSWCNNIKYLFSPVMVKFLSKLEEVEIRDCASMEEVVSNRDDKDEDEEMMISTSTHATTTLVPRLDFLKLYDLKNLKHIGGGQSKLSPKDVNVSWSLCQYSKEIVINGCDALSSVVPSYAARRMENLEMLSIYNCRSMTEVFETEEIYNNNISGCSSNTTLAIPRLRDTDAHKLPNLKILHIDACDWLKNVFAFSTLESLKKLETLTIRNCKAMEVVVSEEYREDTTTSSKDDVVFPSLKSIKLEGLANLAGFFLGTHINFQWPLLDDLSINDCPQMTVFTSGWSKASKLKYIYTDLGKHNIESHINFQTPSSNFDGIRSCPTIFDKKPWSFHNLIECMLHGSFDGQKIFPSNELKYLQKLESVRATSCSYVEEVFEVAAEGTNNKSQTDVVKFPNLREVLLDSLKSLKYLWKSNHERILEFPNLTRLWIVRCPSLEHVFTCSMIGCIMQLQEVRIMECENMKVIVKEEDCDDKVSEIKFPCLKSLYLAHLSSLEGFWLGKEDVTFPSLDTLVVKHCSKMAVFTKGPSVTPELTVIETRFGSYNVDVGEDINTFITNEKNTKGI